jgi:hypothetical protein
MNNWYDSDKLKDINKPIKLKLNSMYGNRGNKNPTLEKCSIINKKISEKVNCSKTSYYYINDVVIFTIEIKQLNFITNTSFKYEEIMFTNLDTLTGVIISNIFHELRKLILKEA